MARRREVELEIVATARAYTDGLFDGSHTLATLEKLCIQLDGMGLEVPADGAKPSTLAPDTSWEAYRSMKNRLGDDAANVLDLIIKTYPVGVTTEDVCLRLNRKHQSMSARVNELRDKGWIVDSTRRRKTTSGRNAIVWWPSPVVRMVRKMT